MSIAIGALQMMLDRGEKKDWFASGEIIIEASWALSAFYLFLVHTFTPKRPFVRPGLFRDRNFVAGMLFIAVVGLTYYASMALQPPYLQSLMNYPVVTAGLVMGPRGVGTMVAMLFVGRLMGRLDTARAARHRSGTDRMVVLRDDRLDAGCLEATIMVVRVIQGVGLGFLFVPLSAAPLRRCRARTVPTARAFSI